MSCQDRLQAGRYELVAGHETTVGGPRLTLDAVRDSRCPPNVQCIWAGRIDFDFTLHTCAGPERFTLAPDRPRHASSHLPGAEFVLPADAPVRPAPRTNEARVDRVTVDVIAPPK